MAEILFSGQGVTDKDSDAKAIFNYLSIPLLATYAVMPELMVHAGLQPSILLSANQKYDDDKFDIKDEFSSLDFSLVFGGEYTIQEQIAAGLRLTLGLNDIADGDVGEARNRVIQLYAIYFFYRQ